MNQTSITPQFVIKNLNKFRLKPYVAVLDIETLSTKNRAAIASIGCVIKNIFTGQEVAHFYQRVNWKEQKNNKKHQLKRVADKNTMKFWAENQQKHPLAYKEVFDHTLARASLKNALHGLNDFLMSHWEKRPMVMGNGSEFDNVIVVNAMEQYSVKPCWDFGCNQSLRSVVLFGRMLLGTDPKYQMVFDGTEHHALDDARHEAESLYLIVSGLARQIDLLNKGKALTEELKKEGYVKRLWNAVRGRNLAAVINDKLCGESLNT